MNDTEKKPEAKRPPPFGKALVFSVIYFGITVGVIVALTGSILPEVLGRMTVSLFATVITTAMIERESKRPWSWLKLGSICFGIYLAALVLPAFAW